MFKRMLSAFGVGGPSVDTVLDSPHSAPGQVVTGQVRIQGGSADVTIGQVVLSLVTRVEVERGDHEFSGTAEFERVVVSGGVQVPAGQLVTVPFQLPLPWETPITAVGPNALRGTTVGVRTELVIAGAPDKGDLDPVAVHPLPSQERVLEAFERLGCRFRTADVEAGRLHGVPQSLGFYQEIEFFPPQSIAHQLKEIELTFVATPHELYVILEADRRGGLFRAGGDTFGRFAMTHQEALATDWTALVGPWLEQVGQRRAGGYGHPGAPGWGPGHHGGPHRGGSGIGGAVAGAAVGFAGGMVMGEVFEGIFDGGDDGGDDGGE